MRRTDDTLVPRAAVKMAGCKFVENDESSQRGSGWSANGGDKKVRGWPEESGAWVAK